MLSGLQVRLAYLYRSNQERLAYLVVACDFASLVVACDLRSYEGFDWAPLLPKEVGQEKKYDWRGGREGGRGTGNRVGRRGRQGGREGGREGGKDNCRYEKRIYAYLQK